MNDKKLISIKIVAAVFFLYATLMQFNDPDPLYWAIIYGVCALLTLINLKRPIPRVVFLVILLPITIWGLCLLPSILKEMAFTANEVEREFLGLFVSASWLGWLALKQKA